MTVKILQGDCREVLKSLADESVHCVVTSPPYWGLRDYGVEEQLGLERMPQQYVENLVAVFREVRRVLRSDGTVWLNLGDSYYNGDKGGYAKDRVKATDSLQRSNLGANFIGAPNRLPQDGLKPKDLVGIPWRVAFALQADGWYLRQDIIWSKPDPMPESVRDRCTKAHEYIFLLAKSKRYYYDAAAIAEPASHAGQTVMLGEKSLSKGQAAGMNVTTSGNGTADSVVVGDTRNKRSVWTVATKAFNEAHFATFPPDLIEPCILAGCPAGGTVLDPFGGAGTTGLVADRHGRNAILIEINPEYAEMARRRIAGDAPLLSEVIILAPTATRSSRRSRRIS